MKIFKILVVSIICFSLQGCPGEPEDEMPDNYFKIQNNFNEDILIQYNMSEKDISPSSFVSLESYSHKVGKGIFFNLPIGYNFFDNKKLWILVYKQSTLDTHTWQEIKDQGLYDKRYDFTLEQLKAINYEIVYTGN